jgi:hypothetical protein
MTYASSSIHLALGIVLFTELIGAQESHDKPYQDPPKSALVIYTDKVEVEVTEWQFRYEWDYDVDSRHYSVAKKTSQDLFVDLGQTVSHGVTDRLDRRIAAAQLAAILYEWMTLKKDEVIPDLRAITVHLRSGEKINIKPKTPWSKFNIGLELEPSIWLLTDKGDVGRNARLYLIGKVRRGDKSLGFEQQLWLPRGSETELVQEIRFQ